VRLEMETMDATFNRAAESIVQHTKTGPAKTGEKCKTKWAGVSVFY